MANCHKGGYITVSSKAYMLVERWLYSLGAVDSQYNSQSVQKRTIIMYQSNKEYTKEREKKMHQNRHNEV